MRPNQEILKEVKDKGIELIRFVYLDADGVVRGYVTTAEELEGDLNVGHPLSAAMPFFSVLDTIAPEAGFGCVGEVAALPDPETFTVLPYASHSALLICDLVTKADHDPTGLCTRSALKEYLSGLDFQVRAAFENEFYLLRRDDAGGPVPFDLSLCFATSGMNLQHELALEIIRALKAQGMRVEKYYPEYGRGQVEIVYGHDQALRTADNQLLFRETLRGVAQAHGLIASLMPKPFPDLAGSGAHLHLSLWQEGRNVFYDPEEENGISSMARHFIGGLLAHLPALCAFTASTVNSYKRLLPHSWASAYACHGLDNREAAVRTVTGMKGREEKTFNLELKPVDGACNPYLALVTALAAGMDGIERGLEPGEPVMSDPHDLAPEERSRRGIVRLPESLGLAVEALEADRFFENVLGETFYNEYLKIKKFAWKEYLHQVTDWERLHYLEAF